MSFSIRKLTADDVEAYRSIRLEGLTLSPASFGVNPETFAARSLDDLRQQMQQVQYFGLFDAEGVIAGTIAYSRGPGEREMHRAWLTGVYVKPHMRGTGAGLAIIEAAVEHARTEVMQLHLMVGVHNLPAIKLYEKAGFVAYGTDPRALCVNGQYIDEHMMVRFLDKAPGKTTENE